MYVFDCLASRLVLNTLTEDTSHGCLFSFSVVLNFFFLFFLADRKTPEAPQIATVFQQAAVFARWHGSDA